MTREERHRATVESHKGERYGKLVIIDEDRNSHERARYLCKCDCGKVISTQYGALKRGATTSCGCARQERNARKHDEATKRYIGRRYGKLTVIAYDKSVKENLYFICKCDCGNIKSIQKGGLVRGAATSCGCKLIERNTKHNLSRTRLYRVFRDMKNRCYNKNSPDYKNYGGRGIKICDEWLNDFTAFNKWAFENGYDENAPKMACTIDRINNDLGYSPENCRWVDIATQNRNKRQRKAGGAV